MLLLWNIFELFNLRKEIGETQHPVFIASDNIQVKIF